MFIQIKVPNVWQVADKINEYCQEHDIDEPYIMQWQVLTDATLGPKNFWVVIEYMEPSPNISEAIKHED